MGVKWVSKPLDICPKTCYNRSRGYRLVSSFGTKRPWVRIPSPRPSKTACKPLKYVVFRLFLFYYLLLLYRKLPKISHYSHKYGCQHGCHPRRPKEHISPRRHNCYLCKCSKIKPLFCATIQILHTSNIFYQNPLTLLHICNII